MASPKSSWMFAELVMDEDIEKITNLTNWFLWSKEEFDGCTNYTCKKMSVERQTSAQSDGGLGLWNWYIRAKAYKAKLWAWIASSPHKELKAHWAKSKSPLALCCKQAAKDFKMEQCNPPSIKQIIQNKYGLTPILIFTPIQLQYKNDFNVDFPQTWSTIRKLPVATKVKNCHMANNVQDIAIISC